MRDGLVSGTWIWYMVDRAPGTYVARACAARQRDYYWRQREGNMRMRNRREELIGQLILVRERLP